MLYVCFGVACWYLVGFFGCLGVGGLCCLVCGLSLVVWVFDLIWLLVSGLERAIAFASVVLACGFNEAVIDWYVDLVFCLGDFGIWFGWFVWVFFSLFWGLLCSLIWVVLGLISRKLWMLRFLVLVCWRYFASFVF